VRCGDGSGARYAIQQSKAAKWLARKLFVKRDEVSNERFIVMSTTYKTKTIFIKQCFKVQWDSLRSKNQGRYVEVGLPKLERDCWQPLR
jgi:hypothetical protein